jgi:hypothetical protein
MVCTFRYRILAAVAARTDVETSFEQRYPTGMDILSLAESGVNG